MPGYSVLVVRSLSQSDEAEANPLAVVAKEFWLGLVDLEFT
ncbi:hypothetical protein [Romeriopsis navalis]|nr:hypothetical protein [Romeriopsis navalis]